MGNARIGPPESPDEFANPRCLIVWARGKENRTGHSAIGPWVLPALDEDQPIGP